jgi:hypothetical protein
MLFFLIIAYVFSSKKLEIKAEQVLSGKEWGMGRRRERGKGGEMAQTMYACVNKCIKYFFKIPLRNTECLCGKLDKILPNLQENEFNCW